MLQPMYMLFTDTLARWSLTMRTQKSHLLGTHRTCPSAHTRARCHIGEDPRATSVSVLSNDCTQTRTIRCSATTSLNTLAQKAKPPNIWREKGTAEALALRSGAKSLIGRVSEMGEISMRGETVFKQSFNSIFQTRKTQIIKHTF